MGFNVFYLFASLLLVSVRASYYDQTPRFYQVSSDLITSAQNENREVILYLTPEQVKSLEENGAVVRSPENPESEEADAGLAEPQVNEDQSKEAEKEEDEEVQPEEEAQDEEPQEQEPEIPEANQDIDFEEILRILNDQEVEEEEAEEAAEEQIPNEPQVEEENNETSRNFSPRITLRQQQQQQEQKNVPPAVAQNDKILKSYSYIRYQPNGQPQRINVQLLQQQPIEANNAEESNEEAQDQALNQERKRYKLIPYEVEEPSEETAQEEGSEQQAAQSPQEDSVQRLNVAPLLDAGRLTNNIGQRKNSRLQNELRLQGILRGLKASSKYNDQKYAIEIEKAMADLKKENSQSKSKSIATPALIMQQISKKRRLNKISKQGKEPARDAETKQGKSQQPKFKKAETPKSIRVPVMKAVKTEVSRPIPVPVETGRRLSVKNVYVKNRTDKPFILSRKTSEAKRQSAVAVPKSKPEKITILRRV